MDRGYRYDEGGGVPDNPAEAAGQGHEAVQDALRESGAAECDRRRRASAVRAAARAPVVNVAGEVGAPAGFPSFCVASVRAQKNALSQN